MNRAATAASNLLLQYFDAAKYYYLLLTAFIVARSDDAAITVSVSLSVALGVTNYVCDKRKSEIETLKNIKKDGK